jgi:hypothetical protein
MQTASYVLDAEAYVQHGAFNDHSAQWGETFRALGGEEVWIRPAWAFGLPVGGMFMYVEGSAAALAFVEDSVAP